MFEDAPLNCGALLKKGASRPFTAACNMREGDNQFSCDYSYEVKKEGKRRLLAIGLILLYVAFTVGYFLLCYISGWIPLFAIVPILLWMLIYFTWRPAFPDVYFEFSKGELSVGHEVGKRRIRREKLRIRVKEATDIFKLDTGRVKLNGYKEFYDMSSSADAKDLLCVVWQGGECALLFDGTPQLMRLLVSYCPNAEKLAEYLKANKTLHKGE